MPLEQAMENLQEFGEELGLAGLEFDESNTCILGIDDDFSLHLTYEPNLDRLYLYSPLLDGFPKNPIIQLHLFTTLLEASMLGGKLAGGGVGIGLKEQLILMHCTLDMHPDVRASALKDFVPLYVETVEKMRKICADIYAMDSLYNSENLIVDPSFGNILQLPASESSHFINNFADEIRRSVNPPALQIASADIANISRKNENQPIATETLLVVVKESLESEDTLDTIRELVSNQANLNGQEDKTGKTSLIYAILQKMPKIVSLLVGLGADINLSDTMTGNTPFHHAVLTGDLEIVKILLEKEADLFAINKKGLTALHIAIAQGKLDIIDAILLHAAQQQTAEILLELTTQKEYTSLQVAIKSKKILDIELRKQIISRLVVSGALISEELNSFAEMHGPHEIAEFLLTLKPSEKIIYMNLAN